MNRNAEVEVLKTLGMGSWRNLSKERFMGLLKMMPELDNELAMSTIAKFPDFVKLGRAAIGGAERAHEATLSANSRNMAMVERVTLEHLAILHAVAASGASDEVMLRALDGARDATERVMSKDSEDKEFLSESQKHHMLVVCAVVFAALLFVGGKTAGLRAASRSFV